jgi:eukaryotic-like serine/threonine-protein kinase
MEQQILNYQIERLLGEGGMSRVYLGIDLKTGQKVAIKELLPHLANHDDLRERFRREAQFMAKLSHKHIVHLIRYEEIGTRLFLVQEYIEGVTLEDYITKERGPIPEEETRELFCQLLEAFAYAHDNGVIHRDIKPSNILITKGNQVKVVDFGIARIAGGNSGTLRTKTGVRMGTVAYMSPEQVNGREVDERTDIYSLGVLLYQMLTGKAPYDMNAESEFEVQVKIVKEPLPRMKSTYEYVSDRMQRIVDKATAKEKGDRYRNCNDFMQAIKSPSQPQSRVQPQPQLQPKISPSRPSVPVNLKAVAITVIVVIFLVVSGVMSSTKHNAPVEAPVEAPAALAEAPAAEAPVEAPAAEAPAAVESPAPDLGSGEYVSIIRSFVEAEDNRDVAGINRYLSENMSRYWDILSPTYEQIYNRYQHIWSITAYSKNTISHIERQNESTYIVFTRFVYLGNIRNQVTVKDSKVCFVFDSDMKIKEIYGID